MSTTTKLTKKAAKQKISAMDKSVQNGIEFFHEEIANSWGWVDFQEQKPNGSYAVWHDIGTGDINELDLDALEKVFTGKTHIVHYSDGQYSAYVLYTSLKDAVKDAEKWPVLDEGACEVYAIYDLAKGEEIDFEITIKGRKTATIKIN